MTRPTGGAGIIFTSEPRLVRCSVLRRPLLRLQYRKPIHDNFTLAHDDNGNVDYRKNQTRSANTGEYIGFGPIVGSDCYAPP